MSKINLTILMPCLNEEETLATCINKANKWILENNYSSEILIADNGSTDKSQSIATSLGARVINVKKRGYGNAIFFGALEAKGKFIIMGDADDSYDFSNLNLFIEKLEGGFDLVMGNRFAGGIMDGAMPWKNKFIGNPILSWLGRLFFNSKIRDFHCGLRGFSKKAFLKMDLRTSGMEFASEMVIKANIFNMKIAEVPTILHKDGRSRQPHLRPWRDGWRHLRFMLLFCPRWLFVIPGILTFLLSSLLYSALLIAPLRIGGINLDLHTLFYAEAGVVLGFLALFFGLIIRLFASREGLMSEHKLYEIICKNPVLEIGSIFGLLAIATGVYLGFSTLASWQSLNFGDIPNGDLLRTVSLSSLSILVGGILLLSSLLMGFITMSTREGRY